MLNEQEREYNGVKLVAKYQPSSCDGCYFFGEDGCLDAPCTSDEREDGQPVIWIQKQEPKPWYPPVPEGFSEWMECGGKNPGLAECVDFQVLCYSERKNQLYTDQIFSNGFSRWNEVAAYSIKLDQPKPKSTHPPIMAYDPATGESKPYPSEASQYRAFHGDVAWLYNPYTRDKRDPRDIGSDVFGHGVKA